MVDAVGTGALLAADSGPELPTVNDFLPPEILFQGTPFAINRIILIRIVATVVLLVVLGITAKRAKLIPRPLGKAWSRWASTSCATASYIRSWASCAASVTCR